MTADQLEDEYGTWGEHPKYSRSSWQVEVYAGDTNAGYWEWVENKIEDHAGDEDEDEPG